MEKDSDYTKEDISNFVEKIVDESVDALVSNIAGNTIGDLAGSIASNIVEKAIDKIPDNIEDISTKIDDIIDNMDISTNMDDIFEKIENNATNLKNNIVNNFEEIKEDIVEFKEQTTKYSFMTLFISYLYRPLIIYMWLLSVYLPFSIFLNKSNILILLMLYSLKLTKYYNIFSSKLSKIYMKYIYKFLDLNCIHNKCKFIDENIENEKNENIENEKNRNNKKTLIAHHPHGMFTNDIFTKWFFYTKLYNSTPTTIIDNILSKLEPFNFYLKSLNINLTSTNAKNLKKHMENGEYLLLFPGGFEEASLCEYKKQKIYIKNRKGFIKYCLQYNYSIIPSYSFSESYYFKNYLHKYSNNFFIKFLNKLKIPTILPLGKYNMPFLPINDINVLIVKGKKIVIENIKESDINDELINKYHNIYINEIKRIFNTYKNEFDEYKNSTLEIY